MDESESKQVTKDKAKRSRRIIVFAVCGLFVLIAILLAFKYRNILTMGIVNRVRDVNSMVVSSRQWAKKLELPGVSNLHKVSDKLYRGAQPTEAGMQQLTQLGIKKVVNLRLLHSDSDELKQTNLDYEHIRMEAWDADDDEVLRFLRIVTDENNAPVFVHCKYGADRTGTMCAIYRIVLQGWSKQEAIDEMTKGGFGFHKNWQNLIEYIRNIDIPQLKHQAGLTQQHSLE